MYKLFLCLKYLRRRFLALIAVAAVALCVMMVLIVVSVMDGFLAKAEQAAKGLFGDIIVSSPSVTGIGRYDEFISRLTGEYRVGGDFVLDSVTGGNRLTFKADGQPIHLESLIGKLTVGKPRTFPGRAVLYRDDQFFAALSGELTLDVEGNFSFVAEGPPMAGSASEIGPTLLLEAVYAKVGEGLPEVEAATPVISSYGLIRAGLDYNYVNVIQIWGIRLPERAGVTNFEKGMFVQADDPHASFYPPMRKVVETTLDHAELVKKLLDDELDKAPDERDPRAIMRLTRAARNADADFGMILALRAELADEKAERADIRSPAKIKALAAEIDRRIDELAKAFPARFPTAANRVILGLGISGLSFRANTGEQIRAITPGTNIVLGIAPIGRARAANIAPSSGTFYVIDDAKTDVHSIDSKTVYIPFDKLQNVAEMYELRDVDDPSKVDPARCSQIQVKVRPEFADPVKLVEVRKKLQREWQAFCSPKYRAEFKKAKLSTDEVQVLTWYEQLADFIGPIANQRTLVALMFGIISFVSVLLIFAIFYMIVMQKIRDIGVIRAVGGSSAGVAQIFLTYGAATGLTGSALGLTAGWMFVVYINEIQDWLAGWSGFRVWTAEAYLFDKIPNQVDPSVAVVIAAWAVVSGLVGALIPAVRAATMEPAEAVRYE